MRVAKSDARGCHWCTMLTKKSAIANLDCVRNMYVSRSIMMKNPCDTVVRVRVCWRYMWCVHDQDCRGVCVSSFAFGGRVPCARVGGVCDYVVALPCFFGFLRMLRSKSPAHTCTGHSTAEGER